VTTVSSAGDDSDVAKRLQWLEERWQQLNSLPTNSEMFRRLHQFQQIEQGIEVNQIEQGIEVDDTKTSEEALAVSSMVPCRPRQPMMELWHAIQLLNQVENNTAGITRVRRC